MLLLSALRSAEVIAVASIIIYDVYQAYVCPFRHYSTVQYSTVQYSTVPGLRVPLQAGAAAWAVHPVRRLAPATPPSPPRAPVPVCQCRQL